LLYDAVFEFTEETLKPEIIAVRNTILGIGKLYPGRFEWFLKLNRFEIVTVPFLISAVLEAWLAAEAPFSQPCVNGDKLMNSNH